MFVIPAIAWQLTEAFQVVTHCRQQRHCSETSPDPPASDSTRGRTSDKARRHDTFAAAFAVAGEDQEKVADKETLVLLKRFSGNPDIEKAKAEFERAQEVEERFHKDFDGVDFSDRTDRQSDAGKRIS